MHTWRRPSLEEARRTATWCVNRVHSFGKWHWIRRITAEGQSSAANQPRTDDGTFSDASRGGATSGGTSATGASG